MRVYLGWSTTGIQCKHKQIVADSTDILQRSCVVQSFALWAGRALPLWSLRDLHLLAKWFVFPHTSHVWPAAGQWRIPRWCLRPQKSHSFHGVRCACVLRALDVSLRCPTRHTSSTSGCRISLRAGPVAISRVCRLVVSEVLHSLTQRSRSASFFIRILRRTALSLMPMMIRSRIISAE